MHPLRTTASNPSAPNGAPKLSFGHLDSGRRIPILSDFLPATGSSGNGRPKLSFGNFDSAGGIPILSDFLPATGSSGNGSGPNQGVNTTQIDGQTSFFEGLTGLGSALLDGIGVRDDRQQQPTERQVSFWQDPEPQGIGIEQIAIFGLIGAGVYFAFGR